MTRRTMIATAIAGFMVGSPAVATMSQAPTSVRVAPGGGRHGPTGFVARSPRPDKADWVRIKTAAGLRRLALAPHRTARFRAFAATLGLRLLVSVHPLSPGRCRTAVIDLYNNLLDLANAYPGEKWYPLRRAVAKEPSIDACAPRPSRQTGARLLISGRLSAATYGAEPASPISAGGISDFGHMCEAHILPSANGCLRPLPRAQCGG